MPTLVKSHHYSLGGLWWSTPARIKTTIRRQSSSSLPMDSCCDLTSCLLGFGGTNVPTWPRWHRSLLTSHEVKKAGVKLEIRLRSQTCQSQWTTCAGSRPRWSCCSASGPASSLNMEMKLLHTHSYWAKDLRGLGYNYILDRHSARGFSSAPLQSETKQKRARLLMVGRQKVLHTVLPGANVL